MRALMMSEKDKKYWAGIARVSEEARYPGLQRSPAPEEALFFLNGALRYVRETNPQALHQDQEPTEIEIYKKWVAIQKKKKSSN